MIEDLREFKESRMIRRDQETPDDIDVNYPMSIIE